MRSLGKLFYIVLAGLTAAILACVILWTWAQLDIALYVMLALFPVYVVFLVLSLTRAKKTGKAQSEEEKLFSELIIREEAKSVYLACYCKTEKLQKPNEQKRLFYAEIYASANLAEVKDSFLTEDDNPLCVGKFALSFLQLKHIRNKTVFINGELFAAVNENELYKKLISENNFVITDKELV